MPRVLPIPFSIEDAIFLYGIFSSKPAKTDMIRKARKGFYFSPGNEQYQCRDAYYYDDEGSCHRIE